METDSNFVVVAPTAEARRHWSRFFPLEQILVQGIAITGRRFSSVGLLPGVMESHPWIRENLRSRIMKGGIIFRMVEA